MAPYTYPQATADIKAIWQKIKSDVQAASYPTLYNLSTERGRQLDHMSIVDWIDESVPGGISSRLGQLLDVAYNIEYGAECSEQSSLNLLYLLGYSGQGQLRHLRPVEREVPRARRQRPDRRTGCASLLAGQITFGLGVDRDAPARRRRVTTSPSCTNGNSVTTSPIGSCSRCRLPCCGPSTSAAAGFSPRKLRAIREQGMGTNSKLNVQFTDRLWRTLGLNGDTYADTGYQATWEVTRAQPGTRRHPRRLHRRHDRCQLRDRYADRHGPQQFASQLEPLLPGISGQAERQGDDRLLAGQPVLARLVLVLEGRAVHRVRRRRA